MLRREFADMPTHDLAAKLGRTRSAVDQAANKMGLRKSAEQRARSQAKTNAVLVEAGKPYRRAAGAAPWNKGAQYQPRGRAPLTQFKRGHKPQTWLPVGTERRDKDGVLTRKVSDTGDRRADWRPVHTLEWEAANGPVPPGHFVLTTGELVTRAELMRRNTYHRYPKEIALAIQLRGAVNRQINRRLRAEQDSGSSQSPVRDA
jgi:hypothetical protein